MATTPLHNKRFGPDNNIVNSKTSKSSNMLYEKALTHIENFKQFKNKSKLGGEWFAASAVSPPILLSQLPVSI